MKYVLYVVGIIIGLPIFAWFFLNLLAIGFISPIFGIIVIPLIIIIPGILIGLKIWKNSKIKELEEENRILRQKLWTLENQGKK